VIEAFFAIVAGSVYENVKYQDPPYFSRKVTVVLLVGPGTSIDVDSLTYQTKKHSYILIPLIAMEKQDEQEEEKSSIASCVCGNLSFICSGNPIRSSVCHCFACQRRTGSAFGVQARFEESKVTVHGDYQTYERTGAEVSLITYKFCGTCGTTVGWLNDKLVGYVAVAVGCFADPSFATPTVSIYEDRMHNWLQIPGDVERYA
jgi:hypothetical protein